VWLLDAAWLIQLRLPDLVVAVGRGETSLDFWDVIDLAGNVLGKDWLLAAELALDGQGLTGIRTRN
jgi:hypothetical protein